MFFKFSQLLNPAFWQQLFQALLQTVKRFPFTSLCLLVLAFIFISQIHNFNFLSNEQNEKIVLLSLAGACWFVAMALFAESKQWQALKHYTLALAAFSLYIWHVFSSEQMTVASVGLGIAAALALTFSPWLRRKQDNDSFWYFNFQLISDAFFAGLSALLLSGGLSLILVSIGYLFDIDIESDLYGDIWVFGTVLFGGFYFLANIPTQFDYDKADCSQFPTGIRFIQTYVLVPLSLIYMMILYAYFIKILFQWELPHGHLAIMVSTFGLIGIITHLTIYPVHDRTGLLGWFYRNFYLAMILPLGLFVFAIAARINQYGLTEKRYILVLVAIWFASLIMARLIRRQQFSLSTVTRSFAALCLIGTIGPWSVDTLPMKSQFSRLQSLLIEHKLLVNEEYTNPHQQPDFETKKSISSMIDYLVSHDNGIDMLRPLFANKQGFDDALACTEDEYCSRHDRGNKLVTHMGIDYLDRWQQENNTYKNIRLDYSADAPVLAIDGYDYLIPLSFYGLTDKTFTVDYLDQESGEISLSLKENGQLLITFNENTITLDLADFIDQFETNGNITISASERHKMIVSHAENNLEVRLNIQSISFDLENDQREINNLSGDLLLKKTLD